MKRSILVVTSNGDSGSGTLRAALEKTQRAPGAYDIVFQGESRGTNTLGTGFFTIRLRTPLPNLYRGDIRINVVSPRSVTLIPERAGESQNLTSNLQQLIGPDGVASPSLLTVGDVQQLYMTTPAAEKPKIQINGFNFVRNRAQGGNGGAGAGGGLGAGGAITFLEGALKISNSVFQDLQAQGGAGGVGARGGNGSLNSGAIVTQRNSNGDSGGTGGFSSIPLSRDSSGTMAYSATGQQLPAGGAGGTRGGEFGFFQNSARSELNGSNGGAGRGASLFGYGGGGGGGGGGRGRGFNFLSQPIYGAPGQGGSGGLGNRFGGSGNPGGRGGNPNPLPGTNGTSGSAIGGAIAAVTRRGDANWEVPEQMLVLDGVDFYNVAAGTSDSGNVFGNIVAGPGWEAASRAGNGVFVRDVSFGTGRNNRTVLNPSAPPPGFIGRYSTATPESTNNPFQSGNSAPRIPTVADTRDTVLSGKGQFSDNFIINYETGSSVFGIASDLADPENPFNVIWRTLVPDREQSILDEYYSAVNTTYWDTLFTRERLDDLLWDVGKAALGGIGGGKAPGNAPATGNAPANGGAAGAVAGVVGKGVTNSVVNFAKDSLAYFNSLGDRANQLDADLAENAATQDQLLQYLNEASATAQIGQIDVGVERSRVIIEGFELGRDSVVFPVADGRTERLAFSISRSSTGTSALDFRYDSGSSTNLPFLSLELDASSDRIINNRQIPLTQYVNSMLSQSEDGRSFVLGAGLNESIVLDSISYTGGPAATTVIVDRRVPPGVRISVETSIGDDAIYGSDGDELIIAHSGNDLVFPAFGADQVNGGEGVDLVSYVRDERALQFRSTGTGSIEVSAFPGQESFVNSVLTDIEGIHAYGKSQIDLSTINRPQNDVFGVISGSGSQILGSNFDDNIEISFFDDYNSSIEDAYRETSFINGASGFNRLRLNFEEAPEHLAFAFSNQGKNLSVATVQPNSGQSLNLVNAQNIDFYDIVFGDDSQNFDLSKSSQNFDLSKSFSSQMLAADAKASLNTKSSPSPVARIHANDGDDKLFGDHNANQFYGDGGNDKIKGLDGRDILVGGDGNDKIRGGRGNDQIYSTNGGDVLAGGKGADSFHFSGNKTDVITDFNPAKGDRVVLDEVEGESVFSVAENKREVWQLQKAGIVNFIYREDKKYALWRGDGAASFSKIVFESSIASSVLMKSVYGRQANLFASASSMEQSLDSQLSI